MLDLKCFRVLDLTGLEGQFAGKVLADLGLEVIKIEPPQGDPVRRLPPFKDQASDPESSLTFLYLNSNKKSITVNLEQQQGRDILKLLARQCDILLESFPPGHLERWGIGYEALSGENPGLVMASISVFGQDGPYAGYQASDLVALAMGGVLSVFGTPWNPPCKPPETQAFYTASTYAALGSLIALYHRRSSGRGQHLDVSIQESLAVEDQILSSFANENFIMRREGGQHKQVSPANVFPCQDGYVYLFVSAGNHWKQFLGLWPDHPKVFDGPEWEAAAYRRQNAAVTNQAVREFTKKFRRQQLVDQMQVHGIPCLPVNTPLEFLEDEQIQARGFLQRVEHPRWGFYNHPGTPYFIDGQKIPITPAPSLGQHNAQVYKSLLNLELSDLAILRAANAI